MNSNAQEPANRDIQVPASTGWPLVAAFGLTLVFAGLLTHVMISTLGAITFCAGLVGWFRQVLPQEAHDSVTLGKEEPCWRPWPESAPPPNWRIRSSRAVAIENLSLLSRRPRRPGRRRGDGGPGDSLRTHRSQEHLVSSQPAGGRGFSTHLGHELRPTARLRWRGTGARDRIHLSASALVGLLYGIALPMFPRRPILLGGILAPLFWSGIFIRD